MSDLVEPQSRHWSQLAAGDVVQVAKTIWMRVESVAHRDEGWIVLVGQDLTGSRRGKKMTRHLGKGRLFPVRPADEIGEFPRLPWTRPKPGTWIAAACGVAYEIKRDRPYRPSGSTSWRMLRDGELWDLVRSLSVAKRSCERDSARRSAERVAAGAVVGGAGGAP